MLEQWCLGCELGVRGQKSASSRSGWATSTSCTCGAASQTAPFWKAIVAGMQGAPLYFASVRPSEAEQHAARSVMLSQATFLGSGTRGRAARVASSGCGGHAATSDASVGAFLSVASQPAHTVPSLNLLMAGTQMSPVWSMVAQHSALSVTWAQVPPKSGGRITRARQRATPSEAVLGTFGVRTRAPTAQVGL